MHMFKLNNTVILIKLGDITQEEVEAIVNPANSYLIMGGGVAGAIKKKGGKIIEEEALKYSPIDIGKAVLTNAGKLKARFVIHSPTMKYPGELTNENNVRSSIKAALKIALEKGIKSIAFPGMGTGVGGISYNLGAKILIEEIKEFVEKNDHFEIIEIVAYEKEFYDELEKYAVSLLSNRI
ncbi:putative phosphatase, C-terminal domain of histone macro H2A1 like protein [Caldisphaera lagunensis DSM 15908]|uniref:Putative phosphatase, C-terminal domain of histone macro H2A1 like protein n=1 Tax=Caldisphaera lagunensis (strain DSM 15908 / JCM 11604 / ANMR 0165 / IC-154) TaxID=1056495 RepID=L0AAJ4_CALLD|nr:macro domain-containing protein [Caldisphaera lagunensis]AFZ70449.1 putative phosphatase, C-terminal domain of histone macro H2A1 like protein [Caldisphaera lagunensis DSM 15908]